MTALFAEPMRQRFFRSKLKLEFDKTEDCITPTPEEDPRSIAPPDEEEERG
jgi:hypothetical protein